MNAYVIKTPGKIKPDVVVANTASDAVSLVNNRFQGIIDDEPTDERDDIRVAMFQGFIDADKEVSEITSPCIIA